MHPRALLAVAAVASVVVIGMVLVLVWQPWQSDEDGSDGASASDEPRLTLEGVIALVSAEHAGCPDQPALVLTADATYDGDGKWTVTYEDYSWEVDEDDESVRTLSEPLPCPER